MAKLEFDKTGEKIYETGVEQCALFVRGASGYNPGVAWNGITSITENPSGAEASAVYADNIKYLNIVSGEDFGATIEAYTYPDEFGVCDGSAEVATGVKIGQQERKPFGLAYKTKIGNDTDGISHGYKLHIIYNAQAAPSSKAYQTINESPEAISFSWEITTTPEAVNGYKASASVTIDSTAVEPAKLTALEKKIYGDTSSEPTLPSIDEIITMFKS